MEGFYKVSLELSLLQAEEAQLSHHVFTGQVLQPSHYLGSLLWTRSNRFMSFLCWGSRAEHSTHESRWEESPPSACWPPFWCIPGCAQLSGLSVHITSTYTIPTIWWHKVYLGRTYSPLLAWVICLISDIYQRCPKLGKIISTLKSLSPSGIFSNPGLI